MDKVISNISLSVKSDLDKNNIYRAKQIIFTINHRKVIIEKCKGNNIDVMIIYKNIKYYVGMSPVIKNHIEEIYYYTKADNLRILSKQQINKIITKTVTNIICNYCLLFSNLIGEF